MREIIQGHAVFLLPYHLCTFAKEEHINYFDDHVGYKKRWEKVLVKKVGKENGKVSGRSN